MDKLCYIENISVLKSVIRAEEIVARLSRI